jgi:hypothetical protein
MPSLAAKINSRYITRMGEKEREKDKNEKERRVTITGQRNAKVFFRSLPSPTNDNARGEGSLFFSYRLEFVVEFALNCCRRANPQGNLRSACETQPRANDLVMPACEASCFFARSGKTGVTRSAG